MVYVKVWKQEFVVVFSYSKSFRLTIRLTLFPLEPGELFPTVASLYAKLS